MKPYPLTFRPLLKRTIWGGRRLADQLGKPLGPESDYAESWEIVDHEADQSVVQAGPLAGRSLAQLLADHRRWLMGSDFDGERFPLLLKYLDCNRVLSVQVHPDDAYGATMPQPDLGKTEAWYVVAADPGSQIYAGLRSGVDQTALRQAIDSGATEQVLHQFHPQVGDVLFIPAGTVHALGGGLLVAEIQQSSDTTFRLFDWNRVDADGHSRPLHLRDALAVTDYQAGPVSPRRADPDRDGWQLLVQCDKFVLRAMSRGGDAVAGDGRFHILSVPRGEATLRWNDDELSLRTGDSVLLPAAMPTCDVAVSPGSTVLESHLPA